MMRRLAVLSRWPNPYPLDRVWNAKALVPIWARWSRGQRDRAEALCREATEQGAQIRTGGHRLNRPGWFLAPTIIDNVTPDMAIAKEEIFGPVLSVLRCDSVEQGIAIANDSDYGLVGGIFTQDIDQPTKPRNRFMQGRSLSMNGMQAAWKPLWRLWQVWLWPGKGREAPELCPDQEYRYAPALRAGLSAISACHQSA